MKYTTLLFDLDETLFDFLKSEEYAASRLMERYGELYRGYGFERNMGYGTKEHIEKLKEIGACPIHRRTFIKNFLGQAEK